MVNTNMLKSKISESGMTMTAFAQKSGMQRETLYNKLGKRTEFTASEIVRISEVLLLTKAQRDKIFFDTKLNRKKPKKRIYNGHREIKEESEEEQ